MLDCKKMPHRGLRVQSVSKLKDRLLLDTLRQSDQTDQRGFLELTPINNRIVRVRYSERDFVEKESDSLVPFRKAAKWQVSETHSAITLSTSHLQVEINRDTCAFTWKTKEGDLISRETDEGGKWIQPIDVELMEWDEGGEVVEDQTIDGAKKRMAGSARRVVDRQAYSSMLVHELQPDESIHGLGQHEDGIFDYSRSSQLLYQGNMKVAIPTFLSSRGYAIHQDQHCLAAFEADGSTLRYWSEVVPQMDYFFIYGPELDDIIGGLRSLTGTPPMLPLWAYGFVQSKERYESAAELVDTVARFRQEAVPIDCIVLDWSSWEDGKWGEKKLDPARFPDPAGMMRSLHDLNARLMVSIWPNPGEGTENNTELRKAGCLLANRTTYNPFKAKAREIYWKQIQEGLFAHGIDAWWCDCSEPFEGDWSGFLRQPNWHRMASCVAEFKRFLDPEFLNAYSLYHARAVYEGQRGRTGEKRVINLTRSACPSQQRYGTVTWSGDIEARWSRLRKQLADGLNFVMTGNPRLTFDIGAFFVKPGLQWFWDGQYPEGNKDLGYRELYVRWFQTGTFLPMFRSHGTDTAREIWNFGNPGTVFYDTIKAFTELRYRLIPYIYSLAAMEVFENYTMFRSLAFDFRQDKVASNISDQFMLGPALLVCPILEPMHYGPHSKPIHGHPGTRRVYLPEGCDWYDFWTNQKYRGGQWLEVEAPLERLPLFVRAGSILPMGPVIQHTGEAMDKPVEVRIYPGKDATFRFYEDAGDGYAYERGDFRITELRWDDRGKSFSKGTITGGYSDGRPEDSFIPLIIQ